MKRSSKKYTVKKTLTNGESVVVMSTTNSREADYVWTVLKERKMNVQIWFGSTMVKEVMA